MRGVWSIIAVCVLSLAALANAQTTQPVRAAVVSVEGEINDFSAKAFSRHIDQAKADGATTIILRINTPGGGVVAALGMSGAIKRHRTDTHFVAYVDTMALSAGSMIALACDEIVMRPDSMLGDCAPIVVGSSGLQTISGAERAKLESPILADFYDSAERSGYDRLLVSSMVQYGVVVHAVQDAQGKLRFIDEKEYGQLDSQQWKPAAETPNPLDGAEQLLTVNTTLAQRIGLSKGTFDSPEELAKTRGYEIVATYDTTFGESVVALLGGPEIRGVLGLIFMLSLYTAFGKPGSGIPEAIAVIAGAMLFGIPLLTGYASWFEISLIMLGIALLAMELFVVPGFGVTGVSGIVCLLVGFVMTFAPPEPGTTHFVPQLQATRHALLQGMTMVTAAMILAAGLWVWLSNHLQHVPYMNRLILNTRVGTLTEEDDVKEAVDFVWPAVGTVGRAATRLTPGGVARFFDPIINDERNVDVVADGGYVDNGAPIIVRQREGRRVVVRAVDVERVDV